VNLFIHSFIHSLTPSLIHPWRLLDRFDALNGKKRNIKQTRPRRT